MPDSNISTISLLKAISLSAAVDGCFSIWNADGGLIESLAIAVLVLWGVSFCLFVSEIVLKLRSSSCVQAAPCLLSLNQGIVVCLNVIILGMDAIRSSQVKLSDFKV
jgi:hypothetical protein